MSDTHSPIAAVGEAASEAESYEAYEARVLAGNTAQGDDPSDVAEPAEDSEDKTASDSETEDDNEQEEQEDDKPKKGKGGFQRKIDKLTARIKELEAKEASGGATAGDAKSAETTVDATPQFSKPKPKLEDFDSIDEHTDALVDWKLEAKEFERESKAQAAVAQKEAQSLIEAWQERVTEVKATHADYDDVIADAKDIGLSPAHQRLFLESEHGAHIAYQLASDQAELKKFAAMSPLAAAKYFGKLEAALGDAPARTKQSATQTRAPKPPATVGARRGSVDTDTYDDTGSDYEAWEAKRNAQLAKQRRAA